jgi:hypothetical protein
MIEPQPETARPDGPKPMTWVVVGVGALAAWAILLPESYRPWNFAVLGAVLMFAAARLSFPAALAVLTVVFGVKEVGAYVAHGLEPYPLNWLIYTLYAVIGRAFLRHTESPLKIGGAAVAGSVVFFLVSNFGSWVEQAMPYGYSLEGLGNCYQAGLPFYRGTLASDLLYTGVLFGLHAALSHAFFPAERVAAATVPVQDTEGGL